jgi:DDE superfamily endonuclease
MCREAGVLLIFLPPYSPDFNPIKFSFSALKVWMQRNRLLANKFSDWYEGFFHMAVQQCGMERHAKGFFQTCFFSVDETNVDVPYHTLE